MKPSTAVIIPARNAEATLADALDSLLAQTTTDWEAIIIDDASTDRTTAIAEDYARRDPRVRWLQGPGEGASAARNLGLSHAAGRWLLFLDSDDWIAPDFLAKMTEAIDREPGAVAAYCGGAEAALAYFALWCAAVAVGRGDDGAVFMRGFSAPPDLKDRVPETGSMIVDALTVGARRTQAALVCTWAAFGHPLLALLRLSDLAMPAPLGFTMGLRVDLRNLASVSPPAGIDLLYAYLCAGPQIVATVEWPVFGLLPARELAELAIDTLGFQHYWKTARLYLAARWWLIGAGKLLRIGGKIVAEAVRCRSVRPMLGNVARSAAIEAAGPPPSPTSSRARLDALIAETRRDAGIVIHGARAQSTAQLIVTHDRRSFWESFFETPDPWNYGSDYEHIRYRRTLDLIRPGTRKALEIGCAEGHFTALLAERVEELVAVDISETALRRARDRCRGRANVRFERLDFSTDPLPSALDLIACSEVLYYLKGKAELSKICDRLANALAPDGRLLSAHSFVLRDDLRHTGFDWDGPFGAKTIAESLSRVSRLTLERSIQTELYRIDLWQRVAASEPRIEPSIQTMSIGATLTPDVARLIVWGGAAARARTHHVNRSRARSPLPPHRDGWPPGPVALSSFSRSVSRADALAAPGRIPRSHFGRACRTHGSVSAPRRSPGRHHVRRRYVGFSARGLADPARERFLGRGLRGDRPRGDGRRLGRGIRASGAADEPRADPGAWTLETFAGALEKTR